MLKIEKDHSEYGMFRVVGNIQFQGGVLYYLADSDLAIVIQKEYEIPDMKADLRANYSQIIRFQISYIKWIKILKYFWLFLVLEIQK